MADEMITDDALAQELAGLGSEEEPAEAPAEDAPADTEETAEAEPGEDGEATEAATEDAEEEASEKAEPEPEADAAEEPAEDPKVAKALARVQREEKRSKDAIARERAEVDKLRSELEPQVAKVREFEAIAAKAKYDPVGVLTALGITEDLFEPAARQLYAMSQAGAKDPKLRDHATRTLRERQQADELARVQQELQTMRQQMEQEKAAVETQRKVEAYLGAVSKAAGDETPLVKSWLAKAPAKAQQGLHDTAERLYREHGELPDPGDVVRELEKTRRAELAELGIDVPSAKPKAAAKKPGATLAAAGSATKAKPQRELSPEELDEQIARELARGALE